MSADYRRPTHLRLLFDIWSMKLFVWLFGQNGELLDSHLFFFDRYSELADHAKRNGFQHIDFGTSTKNGEPIYGLMNFKKEIGCFPSLKPAYTKKF